MVSDSSFGRRVLLKDEEGFFLLTVRQYEDGERLDVLLSRRFRCSRTSLRDRLKGRVMDIHGSELKWSRRLHQGQILRIPSIQRPEPDVEVTYKIIYKDQWMVVVDKGPGAPVHPSRSYRTKTILTFLRDHLQDQGLSPAHRLDRETSGVLVFSRTSEVAAELQRQFSSRLVQKRYLAIVRDVPSLHEQVIEMPLERDVDFPIDSRMRVDFRGKPAKTYIRVLQKNGDRALVEAKPRTGRMHQIRVHLASVSHPILGDKLYQFDGQAYLAMIGDELDPSWYERLGHHRLALHAAGLAMTHPETGEQMQFEAPLPDELQSLLAAGSSRKDLLRVD